MVHSTYIEIIKYKSPLLCVIVCESTLVLRKKKLLVTFLVIVIMEFLFTYVKFRGINALCHWEMAAAEVATLMKTQVQGRQSPVSQSVRSVVVMYKVVGRALLR